MFIRKWRYLQNLENARDEGRQEGLREANERKYAYTTYLEEENKSLQEKLVEAKLAMEARMVDAVKVAEKMVEEAKTKKDKDLIEAFAQELACWQKLADVAYYTNGDQKESSRILDDAFVLKELASKMGICADVFERAYQIYDFRNSGKEGYTLKDGKIVKVEQEVAESECPFVENQESENKVDSDDCDACPGWCPENAGTPDCPVNCESVHEEADEEAPF